MTGLTEDRIDELLTRLQRLEIALSSLVQQRMVKDSYTTAEVAMLLDKAEFTVREWCRLGRISALKGNAVAAPH